jgi:hypothetical protein
MTRIENPPPAPDRSRAAVSSKPTRGRRRRIVGAFIAVAVVLFLLFVHPFLAVTARVPANILVVEGWIPGHMRATAATEFRDGNYVLIAISGLRDAPAGTAGATESDADRAAADLVELGMDQSSVLACPAPFTKWLRTYATACAVRDALMAKNIHVTGINVVTAGPHARETWAAYRRAFRGQFPVGIISVPKKNYPASTWWLTWDGWRWVPKDFVAWLKEAVLSLAG